MHNWINTLLSGVCLLIGALSLAYVRITRSRAEAKVAKAKQHADAGITDRDQIMREYGLLLAGLREELNRQQQDKIAMWDFQMNRAKLEYRKLEQGGAVVADVLSNARQTLLPIRKQLMDLYAGFKQMDQPERDRAATLSIIRNHDPFIVEHLCEPYGMTHGECLLMALSVAKNGRDDDAHSVGG